MTSKAELIGNEWVINGRKIWVSRVPEADFLIVMARVGQGQRHEGVTALQYLLDDLPLMRPKILQAENLLKCLLDGSHLVKVLPRSRRV